MVFLTEHRGNAEQALRFFQALERFVFGCELSVIDNTVREDRFSLALEKVGDPAVYEPGGALDLSDGERNDFVFRLNRSAKIDRQRRMLMIRIEAALGERKVLSRRSDITVEHVLPAGGGPYWDTRFPDRVLRQDAANLLGNLVLITRRQNQRADNKSYPEKRDVYFNTKTAPIHAVTRDIEPIAEWSLDAIEGRHEELMRILGEDWDLVRVDQRR
ncbi:MAG: HNH endonuclease family protein [Terricaulis sp.]